MLIYERIELIKDSRDHLESITCTGLAATRRPATPPPTTRPSGLANETLIPPDLLLVPPFSVGMKEPDNESNSKRPCKYSRSLIVYK